MSSFGVLIGVFAFGVIAGGALTTCFTHYFLMKYQEEKEPEVEEVNITVPTPSPIVNHGKNYDVWEKF